VNIAARLQGSAAPGETLVSAVTHGLSRHAFAFEALRETALKGKAERVAVFCLVGVARRRRRAGSRSSTSATPSPRWRSASTEALTVAEEVSEPQLLFPCYDGLATLHLDLGRPGRGRDVHAEGPQCLRAVGSGAGLAHGSTVSRVTRS
jgi:hypothetical protein